MSRTVFRDEGSKLDADHPDHGVKVPLRRTPILRIAPGGDWKIVRNLAPGDRVRTALNGHVEGGRLLQGPGNDLLTVIEVTLDRSPRRVYNFEVEGLHSYAVGPLGEWVHNASRTLEQQIIHEWAKEYAKRGCISPREARALVALAKEAGVKSLSVYLPAKQGILKGQNVLTIKSTHVPIR